MATSIGPREERLRAGLRAELEAVDGETLAAVARALEREHDRLAAGSWGSTEDGDGCLLTLAARELGLPHGEALMLRSIAAVRIPALFDEFWSVVLERTGSPTAARELTHRIVADAIAAKEAGGPARAQAASAGAPASAAPTA